MDISDSNVLAGFGVRHDLFESIQEGVEWFDGSDDMEREVWEGDAVSRRLGVTGVPFLVFEGRWAVSGAMGVEAFVNVSRIWFLYHFPFPPFPIWLSECG